MRFSYHQAAGPMLEEKQQTLVSQTPGVRRTNLIDFTEDDYDDESWVRDEGGRAKHEGYGLIQEVKTNPGKPSKYLIESIDESLDGDSCIEPLSVANER